MSRNNVYTTSNISFSDLQKTVTQAEAGTTVHLSAGTYTFEDTLIIDNSDVWISGAGSGSTVIEMAADMLDKSAIQLGHHVYRPEILKTTYLERSAQAGDTNIKLVEGHQLSVGDHIYITQENTEAFLDEIGDTLWRKESALRTILVEVLSVHGQHIVIDSPLQFDFDFAQTSVQTRTILEKNALAGFTIATPWGQPAAHDFSNALNSAGATTAVMVAGITNATLTDIEIINPASHGITVANSREFNLDGAKITGAHDKGAGGNGYGIHIRDVYDSDFRNLHIDDTRHAVSFGSYSSASGNSIHVVRTNRDINFHGGRDTQNTVVVDQSYRSEAEASHMSPVIFFNNGTTYGAPTDASQNSAKFRAVSGTVRADNVVSHDDGSTISLRGGNDTAKSGNGDDKISLGPGNDIVFGSDGLDMINGGYGADTIVFKDNFSSFNLTVNGATVVISSQTGTSRIREVESFVFADQTQNVSQIYDLVARDKKSAEVLEPNEPVGTPILFTDGEDANFDLIIEVTENEQGANQNSGPTTASVQEQEVLEDMLSSVVSNYWDAV